MSLDRLNQIQRGLAPTAAPAAKPSSPANAVGGASAPSFADALQQQQELKLSAHAQTRLASRSIHLDQAQWQRVQSGVEKAAQKGARESLVLMDDVAFVVSVRNKTVITAVDKENLKENVFTNIDSAVIV